MSIWGTLGKIALGAGGLAAAPFTGGLSAATLIPGLIGAGTSAAGAIAEGRAQGRQAEAGANAQQDTLRQRADENRLAAQKFNAGLPGLRANDAVRGDTLANVQDAAFTGSGRDLATTGGLRPSLLSGQTRALGQAMGAAASGNTGAGASMDPGRAALLQQLAGSYQPFKPEFTTATPLPQAGMLDKILQGAGYAGGVLPLLGQSRAGKPGQPAIPNDENGWG